MLACAVRGLERGCVPTHDMHVADRAGVRARLHHQAQRLRVAGAARPCARAGGRQRAAHRLIAARRGACQAGGAGALLHGRDGSIARGTSWSTEGGGTVGLLLVKI